MDNVLPGSRQQGFVHLRMRRGRPVAALRRLPAALDDRDSERNISRDISLSRALVLQGDKNDLFNITVAFDVYHNGKNLNSTNMLALVRDSIRQTTMLT